MSDNELDALFDGLQTRQQEYFTAAQTVALWGDAVAGNDRPGETLKAADALPPLKPDNDDTVVQTAVNMRTVPARKSPPRSGGMDIATIAFDDARRESLLPQLRTEDDGDGGCAVEDTVVLTMHSDGYASMTMPGASVTLAPRSTTVATGGEYEIGDVLGVGGMGVVNVARQASLDRRIVVKSIRPEFADRADAQQKFITEALATASLDHPNVVPIHDMGVGADGHLFYVMKEVKGDNWRKKMRSLAEQENLDILLRVCDAVACAHDKGIIHRDLKPDNVMLGDYGEVLLMDWGLAAAVTADAKAAHLTNAAACAGTPSFMAPEMARGLAGGLGAWSDQYLLGAMLFNILTGRPPHPGKTAQEAIVNAANNVLMETPRDDEWMNVARRAMQTEPYLRYPSVKDFQKALRSCQIHNESILLTNRGDEQFAKAKEADGYDGFAHALNAYEQALVLWPENAAAVHRRREARYAYAERAFDECDYSLVVSLLSVNPDRREEELIAGANEEIRQTASRRRRVKIFGAVAVAALALVAAVGGIAYVVISRQAEAERQARAEAEAQRRTAVAERARADEQRGIAEEQRGIAETQRDIAEQARSTAEDALAAAQRARASEARAQELQLREQAAKLAAEEQARQRAEEALAAREEIQRLGYLEDNSRWRFTPEEAVERRAAAARESGLPLTRTLAVNGASLDFGLIPAGFFVMGSPPRDPARNSDEYLHEVELTHAYHMGTTEVTRAQWRAVVGVESPDSLRLEKDPDDLSGMRWRSRPLLPAEENLPAAGVSCDDIFDIFLPALERALGPGAELPRLPTEAEWEWAARAGAIGHYYNGDTEEDLAAVAWYDQNSSGRVHPVGGKLPNAWGLHDMLGNVWEFTLDSYDALYYLRSPRRNPVNLDVDTPAKISRGGSYINSPRLSRIPCRSTYTHEQNRYPHAGFRLVIPTAGLEE